MERGCDMEIKWALYASAGLSCTENLKYKLHNKSLPTAAILFCTSKPEGMQSDNSLRIHFLETAKLLRIKKIYTGTYTL